MRFLSILVFALLTAVAHAAPSKSTQTLEVSVEGLNCALCGDAMKLSLKKVTGAQDLEPNLECGRIYLEMDVNRAASLNEAGLTFTLLSNGFNFKGIRPVPESLATIRSTKAGC